MEQRTYVIEEGNAAGEVCESFPDTPSEKLDEINAKLDLLLASQGIETNKEVIE